MVGLIMSARPMNSGNAKAEVAALEAVFKVGLGPNTTLALRSEEPATRSLAFR